MTDNLQQLIAQLQALPPAQRAQVLVSLTPQPSGGVNLGSGNTIERATSRAAASRCRASSRATPSA